MTLKANYLNEGNKTILKVSDQINISNVPEFEQELISAVKDRNKTLLLDFTELEFISSAGIRILILLSKELAAEGRTITCLLKKNSRVRYIFYITGLSSVLGIQEV